MSAAHHPPKPVSAPTMSAPQEGDSAVQALAASIYIQLVKDAVVIGSAETGGNTTITANAESLARISYKLAEAFIDTGDAIRASAKPKTAVFDVNQMDFGS